MSLAFEVIWLSYKEDISKFVGIVKMLNVSEKNIIKDFNRNLCAYIFTGHFVTPPGQPKLSIFTMDGLVLCLTISCKAY